MPIVGFTPTKARLVLEENKESVLVMRVVLAKGESVELATGGELQALAGVIRIRERRTDTWQSNGKGVGSLVFVDAGRGGAQESAKFQINISISTKKFDALLKIAISGRLPSKFFVDAGEKVSRTETQGMTYRMAPEGRTKFWDNRSFAFLPVTSFSAIIPIAVSEPLPGSFHRSRRNCVRAARELWSGGRSRGGARGFPKRNESHADGDRDAFWGPGLTGAPVQCDSRLLVMSDARRLSC